MSIDDLTPERFRAAMESAERKQQARGLKTYVVEAISPQQGRLDIAKIDGAGGPMEAVSRAAEPATECEVEHGEVEVTFRARLFKEGEDIEFTVELLSPDD